MKKEVPLAVLRAIEPKLSKLAECGIIVERIPSLVLRLVDSVDKESIFFEITAINQSNALSRLELKYKPKSNVNTFVNESIIDTKNFEDVFKYWVSIVEGYNSVKSLFDDPILKQYADDFYTEFESADPDATTASFNLKQQLLLDSALSQVIQVLDEHTIEANKEIIAEIIEEAEEIQNTVTENTKQETLSKMSKLFARIQKVGIKVIKHVAPIIEKEIIGAVIKSGVTAAGTAAAVHLLSWICSHYGSPVWFIKRSFFMSGRVGCAHQRRGKLSSPCAPALRIPPVEFYIKTDENAANDLYV